MKEFIIGRSGNQPFKIDSQAVSAEHARLTIGDDGTWTLEDLRGTAGNGTFIRDDGGNFTRVLKARITEQTVIRLASVSEVGHHSFTFMAHHVLAAHPNDYGYEFKCVRRQWEALRQQEASVEESAVRLRYYAIAAPMAGFLFSCIPPFNSSIGTVRLAMVIPPVAISLLSFRQQSRPKALLRLRRATIVCPRCGRPLSDYDVEHLQCSYCKAQ